MSATIFRLQADWLQLAGPARSCCNELHSILVQKGSNPSLKQILACLKGSKAPFQALQDQLSTLFNKFVRACVLPASLDPLEKPHSLLISCLRMLNALQEAAAREGLSSKQLSSQLANQGNAVHLVKLHSEVLDVLCTMARAWCGQNSTGQLHPQTASTHNLVTQALEEGLINCDALMQTLLPAVTSTRPPQLFLFNLLRWYAESTGGLPTLVMALNNPEYLQAACQTAAEAVRKKIKSPKACKVEVEQVLENAPMFFSVLLQVMRSDPGTAHAAWRTRVIASAQLRNLAAALLQAAQQMDSRTGLPRCENIFKEPVSIHVFNQCYSPTYTEVACHVAALALFGEIADISKPYIPVMMECAQHVSSRSQHNQSHGSSSNPSDTSTLFTQWTSVMLQSKSLFLWPFRQGGFTQLYLKLPEAQRPSAVQTMMEVAMKDLRGLAALRSDSSVFGLLLAGSRRARRCAYERSWDVIEEGLVLQTSRDVALECSNKILAAAELSVRQIQEGLLALDCTSTMLQMLPNYLKDDPRAFSIVDGIQSRSLMLSLCKMLRIFIAASRSARPMPATAQTLPSGIIDVAKSDVLLAASRAVLVLLEPFLVYWLLKSDTPVPPEACALITQVCLGILASKRDVGGKMVVIGDDEDVCEITQRLSSILTELIDKRRPALQEPQGKMMLTLIMLALTTLAQLRPSTCKPTTGCIRELQALMHAMLRVPYDSLLPGSSPTEICEVLNAWLDEDRTGPPCTTRLLADHQEVIASVECGMQPSVGCWHRECTNLSGPSEAELETHRCKGCKVARYCSVECHQADWQWHQKDCQVLHVQRKERLQLASSMPT